MILRNLNSVKHNIKASKYTHTLLCYSYILKSLQMTLYWICLKREEKGKAKW